MRVEMADLLQTCVDENASDLHINVGVAPTLRVHGRMVPMDLPILTPDDTENLMKAITSEEHIQKTRQIGGSDFGFAFGNAARFRVSVFRSKGNFGLALRQIPNKLLTLEQIGLPPSVKDLLFRPRGLILVTGPTGSGKSTTLIAALYQVIDPTVNVLTIEEPVEYIIKGARQLKIGPKMGFEQSIRGILRHDPDIVLVGEMRDKITAETAIKLANTGHLVFSTLHTNDAPGAVARLYKMGIEPFLIAYAINIIVAQRLIRTLCKICKEPIEASEMEDLLKFGFSEEELKTHTIYRAVGCEKCNGGYKGRAAIHEALFFSKEIRNIILNAGEKVDESKIRDQAAKDGMWTLRRSGMERMMEGTTTLEEVISTTVEDE